MTPAVHATVRSVAAEFQVTTDALLSPGGVPRHVSGARHALFGRLRRNTQLTGRQIALALGFDPSTVTKALQADNTRRARMAAASHRKEVARDFIDSPKQLRWLFNGQCIGLSAPSIFGRLTALRSYELQRIPHERRREPNARRVPAEQRIDDIDAALLAARYVRRFGNGH